MDHDALDRLLMDRAVGELNADVEALLDEYLERHPATQEHYLETVETVKLSRSLLRSEDREGLPAFQVSREFVVSRRRMTTLQTVGMAASLLICFFMGRQFAENKKPIVRTPVVAQHMRERSESTTGIWSLSRFRTDSKPIRESNWKWSSPVQQPKPLNQGELL